jgi:beta-alanine--pyruvate transaminase
VGKRAYEAMDHAFREEGLMIRITGETLALTPPLIITEDQIGELVERVRRVVRKVAG